MHVIDYESLEVTEDLSYEEKPMTILAREGKTLHYEDITFVNVLWRKMQMEEAMWEQEEEMREKHLELFLNVGTFQNKSPFRWTFINIS